MTDLRHIRTSDGARLHLPAGATARQVAAYFEARAELVAGVERLAYELVFGIEPLEERAGG